MPTQKTFHLTSLGCPKNSVDTDSMAQLLERDGYHQVGTPQQASILIVNTCGFIGSAREESYSTLRALAESKHHGQILIATGCLTQRYGAEVARRVPGVNGILGTRRWMDIVEVVRDLRKGSGPKSLYHLPETPSIGIDEQDTLRASFAGASAYIKIADGCRRPCAFCAIPLIKGSTVSRPMDKIIHEARILRDAGIRELILIAQDTTDYGFDLGMENGLATLLKKLTAAVPDMDWIRIMYSFPGYVTDRLIDLMAGSKQILPYLDMPLQHAHPATLTRMRRPADTNWIRRTISKMRSAMPAMAIRTVFIVGYPGETEEEFQTLLDFVEEIRFDRVGTFQFSFEHGTASEQLGDPVPAEVKEERFQRLMLAQQPISLQINQSFVGRTLDILIEGHNQGLSIGRSYRDAPEVDGMVLVNGTIPIGEIVPVKVTEAMEYDIHAEPINKQSS